MMDLAKLFSTIGGKLNEVTKAIVRFPATFLLLITIAVLNAISIENEHDFKKQIIALVFAVFCFVTARILSERFGKRTVDKILYLAGAAVLSVGYYLLILPAEEITMIIGIKTIVAVFALFVAFIWIPSIKGRADFNAIFMNVFKSFFTSAFFSGIIFGGVSLVIAAIDTLLVPIDENAYIHAANIIWVIWAPMLMLSLIPAFGSETVEEEKVQKASRCPRFFEVLLSYVLVPLAAIYTLVLLLYIIKTLVGGSWTANLLEPLILSYCIAVLLLYVLLSNIENFFAVLFKKVFPKLLIPIALFQIVSSSILVFSEGLVHTRYFVLMFSLYSVVCGVLLSILPVKKNGVIAILAIGFALVCITPKIDAFSVSIASQRSIIEKTLEKNAMIEGSTVKPNANLSDEDKKAIVTSVSYLSNIDQIESVSFLPASFDLYNDFESTFGFTMYDTGTPGGEEARSYSLDLTQPIEIDSYDYLASVSIGMPSKITDEELGSITKGEKQYRLMQNISADTGTLTIVDANGTQLITVSLEELFESLSKIDPEYGKGLMPAETMTFDYENSAAKMRIVVRNASIYSNGSEMSRYADTYVLFSIK